jgi:iron(III) transport system substrate-binding protein
MRSLKKFVCLLMVMIMAAFMTACAVKSTSGDDTEDTSLDVTEAAGEEAEAPASVEKGTEGTITVYTALEDDIIQTYLESFHAKYPDIEVEIVRDATGTIIAKAIAEKDNPVADVVWGTSASVLLQLDNYELIKEYTPEGSDKILANFKDSDADGDGELSWTGIDVYESAFLVNVAECEAAGVEIPASFEDLLKEQYKGLIVMPDPTSSGTGLLTVNGILQSKGEEAGWDYLTKLNENISLYTTSGSKPAKMAAAGECAIGISFGYRCATLYQENGDAVKVVFPSEGSGWDVEANCLINKSEINPCAYTFLDWAISDEAMQAYSTEYPITGIGVINDIPAGYSEDPMKNLVNMDLVKAANERDSILEKFTPFLAGKQGE